MTSTNAKMSIALIALVAVVAMKTTTGSESGQWLAFLVKDDKGGGDPECTTNRDCDDGDPKTINTCNDDQKCEKEDSKDCTMYDTQGSSACDDNDTCTKDTCVMDSGTREFKCMHYNQCDCKVPSDCDDGDDDTIDKCTDGECTHEEMSCTKPDDCIIENDFCMVGLCSGGKCIFNNNCCESDADCPVDSASCTRPTCITLGDGMKVCDDDPDTNTQEECECSSPTDCIDPNNQCKQPLCEQGKCTYIAVPAEGCCRTPDDCEDPKLPYCAEYKCSLPQA